MTAPRRFWLRARGRSKTQDAGAATLAAMIAGWGGGEPRELIIDEEHHFEDTPEMREWFGKMWQRLREQGGDGDG
jgi:hypothetical protein